MRKGWITLVFLLLAAGAFAQSTGFRLGGRFGAGVSRYTPVEGISFQDGTAIEGGFALSVQPLRIFAVEAFPAVSMRKARATGMRTDGTDPLGNPREYTFSDKYAVYSADIPVVAKLSLGFGGLRVIGFAGPGIGFRMFGFQSREYNDVNYNAKYGYRNSAMKDLAASETFGVVGAGVQLEVGEGVFGVDARFRMPFQPTGRIEEQDFRANTMTVGLTYYR